MTDQQLRESVMAKQNIWRDEYRAKHGCSPSFNDDWKNLYKIADEENCPYSLFYGSSSSKVNTSGSLRKSNHKTYYQKDHLKNHNDYNQ